MLRYVAAQHQEPEDQGELPHDVGPVVISDSPAVLEYVKSISDEMTVCISRAAKMVVSAYSCLTSAYSRLNCSLS
eukprot:9087491-Heterocapsa_arctica.AAC.1